MKYDENTAEVTQRLIAHYKLPVSKLTIEETIISHPEYPSLKSICDSMKEWNIKHYPIRLNKEELREAESPFIAHLNEGRGYFVFVPGLNGNAKVHYYDNAGKRKTESEDIFFNKYSGVSLLIDPDEKAGEDGYHEKKQNEMLHRALPWLASLALTLFVIFVFLSNENQLQDPLRYAALLLTKICGLFLSALLTSKDLNLNVKLADSLCSVPKKTNCNSILRTGAAKVFGWMHWSDIGSVYFISGLLMMLSFPSINDLNLLAIISTGALFYVIYSIYYQAFTAKSWCPLCLGVQIIFLVEFMINYPYLYTFEVSFLSILKFTMINLIFLFVIGISKIYMLNRNKYVQDKLRYLKFKKNPKIFTTLLKQGKRQNFDACDRTCTIGDPSSPIEVTAFLSLNCNPCKKAFNQMKTMFTEKDIKFNLIFSPQDRNKNFMNRLVQLFKSAKQNEAVNLLSTWYNSSERKRIVLTKQEETGNYTDFFTEIQKCYKECFSKSEVTGTPTFFVNGYRIPKEYQVADLSNFRKELKK